jgi:polyhydroxybutyrate depolymerase
MNRLAAAPIAILTGLVACNAATPEGQENALGLDLEGGSSFIVRASDDANAGLLLLLHGGGGSAEQLMRQLGDTLDDRWTYVFATRGRHWNDGRRGLNGEPLDTRDDVSYLSELSLSVAEQYDIHRERIFVAGLSNGAMMSIRLVCERRDVFAGAGVVAAPMQDRFECADPKPTPMIFIHGDKDSILPVDGGAVATMFSRDRGGVLSMTATMTYWANVNECDGEVLTTVSAIPDLSDDGMTSTVTSYENCAAPLTYVKVEGGGHSWPGSSERGFLQKRISGAKTRDFNGTAAITSFFETGAPAFPPAPDPD